ncbi:MAG TPA: hypothetical protein VIE39_00350 [Thermoanaerobaculia bacterium]|jgi:hypothetical protein
MSRIAPRGLSLVWVVLLAILALDCSHATGANAGPAQQGPPDAPQVKAVGIRIVDGVVTVSPDPIVVTKDRDLLVFVSESGPLSIQFKDDNNPFKEQPECKGRSCIFRVPATMSGTYHYTVMVRGKTKDPRVEVQP